MDGEGFDAFVRSLQSRRRVVQTLVGLGVGSRLAGATAAAPTPAVGARFGCTKHDNSCRAKSADDVPCPEAPNGFCVNDNKGKPFCAGSGACGRCKRNTDCVADFGPTARCIKECPVCTHQMGAFASACVVPFKEA